MTKNKIKTLLNIVMITFSLFIFAAPIVDANIIKNSSEKSIDFEEDFEQDILKDFEKNKILLETSLLYTLCSRFSNTQPIYILHLHKYKNNSSLYKPPILHS